MISSATYQALKGKYGKFSSWALWNVTDPTQVIHKRDCGLGKLAERLEDADYRQAHLSDRGILLGLNWASRGNADGANWENFHDTSAKSRDYNTVRMIMNTPFEGCYITDIIKDFPESDAQKVLKEIKLAKNATRWEQSLASLQTEFDLIQPQYVLLFGQGAQTLYEEMVATNQLNVGAVQVITLPHWSAQTVSKVEFLAEADKLRQLKVD
ncbi:uracil-DNA glycosylase family protein [Lactiplantibacillus modestisalitolerans]|uniref:Uracil-DNA glycosylase family protein n=1 Tax=Lactiplantibacillus modestisalitolerans TaxID=1457219 RepID=A0ABV5WSH4_9LACO|nr:uracil-DNA glycosylase family protein [Lactiplantibacillus modestisalitolerans]